MEKVMSVKLSPDLTDFATEVKWCSFVIISRMLLGC